MKNTISSPTNTPPDMEAISLSLSIAYQQFIDWDNPKWLLQWLTGYKKIIVESHIAPIVNILAHNLTHEALQQRRSEWKQPWDEWVDEFEIWRWFSVSLPWGIDQIIELLNEYSIEIPETEKEFLKAYILSQLEELRITPNLLFTQAVATIAYSYLPMNAVSQATYHLVNWTIH